MLLLVLLLARCTDSHCGRYPTGQVLRARLAECSIQAGSCALGTVSLLSPSTGTGTVHLINDLSLEQHKQSDESLLRRTDCARRSNWTESECSGSSRIGQ